VILIVDCDNTLYPASTNLMALNDAGIASYLTGVMGVSVEQAEGMRIGYLRKYGTTLAGLVAEQKVDPDEFLDYVHSYEVSPILSADPVLREFLCGLKMPRVVLTSANRAHVEKVARALGVLDCIDAIFDLKAVDYLGKPHPHAYETVLAAYPGERAVFVDDRFRNFPPARALNMVNVWVDEGYRPPPGDIAPALNVFYDEARQLAGSASEVVDFTIHTIDELPAIWDGVVARVNGR